ncbi:MAG: iron transporter, partial [Corynebacterium sp.]|nr:iron transporter [Corynebacterium sp.]
MKQNTVDGTKKLKLSDGGHRRHSVRIIATSALMASLIMAPLAACSSSDNSTSASGGNEGGNSGPVTVKNCGKDATYPSTAKHMYVNDGNMIATT